MAITWGYSVTEQARLEAARELRLLAGQDPSAAIDSLDRILELLTCDGGPVAERLRTRAAAAEALREISRYDATVLEDQVAVMADTFEAASEMRLAEVESVAGHHEPRMSILEDTVEAIAHTVSRGGDAEEIATEAFVEWLVEINRQGLGRGFAIWCLQSISYVRPHLVVPYSAYLEKVLDSAKGRQVGGAAVTVEALAATLEEPGSVEWPVTELLDLVATAETVRGNDSNAEYGAQAIETLSDEYAPALQDAVPRLVELVAETSPPISVDLATALANLASEVPDAVAPVESEVLTALESADPEMSVLESTETETVERLLAVLRDLGDSDIGGEELPEGIAEYLTHERQTMQLRAAELINSRLPLPEDRLEALVEPLVTTALNSETTRVRRAAAVTLRQIEDTSPGIFREYTDQLSGVIEQEEDPLVRGAVGGILAQYASESSFVSDTWDGAGFDHGRSGFAPLGEQLDVQDLVADLADEADIERDVEDLLIDLYAESPDIRGRAAMGLLLQFGGSQAAVESYVDELVTALHEAPEETHPPLVLLVISELPILSEEATRRLIGSIDLSAFDEELYQAAVIEGLLPIKDDHPELFTEFLQRHVKLFESCLDSSDPVIVGAAASALGYLAEAESAKTEPYVRQFAELVNSESPFVRGIVAENFHELAKIRPRVVADHVGTIQPLFQDPDTGARYHAVSAVAEAADELPRLADPYLDDLTGRLDDENDRIRASALEAIAHYSELSAEDTINQVDLVVGRLSDESPEVRLRAALVLAIFVSAGYTDRILEHIDTIAETLTAGEEEQFHYLNGLILTVLAGFAVEDSDRVVESIDFDELAAVIDLVEESPREVELLPSATENFCRVVKEHGAIGSLPESVQPQVEKLANDAAEDDYEEFLETITSRSAEPARQDATGAPSDEHDGAAAASTDDTEMSIDDTETSTDSDESQNEAEDPAPTELPECEPVPGAADGDLVVDGTAYVLDEAKLIDALADTDRDRASVLAGLQAVAETRPDELRSYTDEIASQLDPAGESEVPLLKVLAAVSEKGDASVAEWAPQLCSELTHSDPDGRTAAAVTLLKIAQLAADVIGSHEDELEGCVRRGGRAGRLSLAALGRAATADATVLRPHIELIVESIFDETFLPTSTKLLRHTAGEFPAEVGSELDRPITILESPNEIDSADLDRCIRALAQVGLEAPEQLEEQLPVLNGLLTTTYTIDPEVRSRVFQCIQMVTEITPGRVAEAVDLERVADFVTDERTELQREALKLLGLTTNAVPEEVGSAAGDQLLRVLNESDDGDTLTLGGQVLRDICFRDGGPAAEGGEVMAPHAGQIVETLPAVGPELQARLLQVLISIARAEPSHVIPYAETIVAKLESDNPAVRGPAAVVVASFVEKRERLPVGYLDGILSVLIEPDYDFERKAALNLLLALSKTEPDRLENVIHGLPLYLRDQGDDIRRSTIKILYQLAKRTPDLFYSSTVYALADLSVRTEEEEFRKLAFQVMLQLEEPDVLVPALDLLFEHFDRFVPIARTILISISKPVASEQGDELTPHVDTIAGHLHEEHDASRSPALDVLARVASDAPDAVAPHTDDVLAFATDEKQSHRLPAMGFASDIAAHRPETLVPHAETLAGRLDDTSNGVRRLAVSALRQVATEQPDAVASAESELFAELDTADQSIARKVTGVVDILLQNDAVVPSEPLISTLVAPTDSPDLRAQRTEALQTIAEREPLLLIPEKGALQRRAAIAETETATKTIDILSRLPSHSARAA